MEVEPLGIVSQHSKVLNFGLKHAETDRANRVRRIHLLNSCLEKEHPRTSVYGVYIYKCVRVCN